jgi:hypothetical protein
VKNNGLYQQHSDPYPRYCLDVMNQMAVLWRTSKTFFRRWFCLSKIAAASFPFFKEVCHEKDDSFVGRGVTKFQDI